VLMATATAGDAVAYGTVDRMAEEVVTLARVALSRLDMLASPMEVVLGGGVLQARIPVLMQRIQHHATEQIPAADLIVASEAPVLGAARLGLDSLRREGWG
jgi:predicted NBD/HSP70 family sugar kinase